MTDLQISEDGEQANGTVVSVLSFTYVAPNPKNSFIGIQPVIRDYPAPGDLTEFWPLGSGAPGGGARQPQAGVPSVPSARGLAERL